jgi:hypothetical protein
MPFARHFDITTAFDDLLNDRTEIAVLSLEPKIEPGS